MSDTVDPELDPLVAHDAEWNRQRREREAEQPHTNGDARGAGDTPRRFNLVRFKDIILRKATPYLVAGLLPREGLVVVWGPPKSGKTFWMFDVGMHVALGWDYRGRWVEQGAVVYVASEGERGLSARKEAFRLRKLPGLSEQDPPFYLLTTRLNLVADVETLIADIRAQLGGERCALIVIDTLNRTIAGSESDDRDMTAYVNAPDCLREAFRAGVAIIHHCGTNEHRPRGHTSLTGAVDAQLATKKDQTGHVIVTVEYMKDGPEGAEIRSRPIPVDVVTDDTGAQITSCIVQPAEEDPARSSAPPSKNCRPKLSAKNRIALDALRKAVSDAGERAPASNHIPAGASVVSIDLWRRFYLASTSGDKEQSEQTRRRAPFRVREGLQAKGIIGTWEEVARLV